MEVMVSCTVVLLGYNPSNDRFLATASFGKMRSFQEEFTSHNNWDLPAMVLLTVPMSKSKRCSARQLHQKVGSVYRGATPKGVINNSAKPLAKPAQLQLRRENTEAW
eukprot:1799277-Amphidinium_carterae.2